MHLPGYLNGLNLLERPATLDAPSHMLKDQSAIKEKQLFHIHCVVVIHSVFVG